MPITAGKHSRRWITLICAGRNRRDMIRRELPRSEIAGWVRRPYRTVFVEGSASRGPSAVIGAAVQPNFTVLGHLSHFELRFGLNCDGPQEPQQLAGQRRHPPGACVCREPSWRCSAYPTAVAFSRRSAWPHHSTLAILVAAAGAVDRGRMPVTPSRLHQNPAQMCIAGLGDRAALMWLPLECSRGTRPV